MKAEIICNKVICSGVNLITFKKDNDLKIFPGQFLSIKLNNSEKILRRPFSIYSHDDKGFSILVKTVGCGTEKIASLKTGYIADILVPLGSRFKLEIDYDRTLFIAGGIGLGGIGSFFKKNENINLIFGDKSGEYRDAIEYLNLNPLYVTENGAFGKKGFVTDYIDKFQYNTIFACGPKAMLKAIKEKTDKIKYYAVCEEIMACGLGLCNGCTVKYNDGTLVKVCTDGPVLSGEKIVYD